MALFEQLLASVRKEHFESHVAETLLDIMCDVLNELDDVPDALLETVLRYLQPAMADAHAEAHQLSKHLLLRCSQVCEPAVRTHVAQLLEDAHNTPADGAVLTRPFRLIYELFCVQPDLLLHILPMLERDLCVADDALRRELVATLCRLYSHPTSQLHSQSTQLLAALLERFADKDALVRGHVVALACQLLQLHRDELPAALVEDLMARLDERSRDPDESVRFKTVEHILELARVDGGARVPAQLLRLVGARCVDSRAAVNSAAVLGLARAYHEWSLRQRSSDARFVYGACRWL